MDKPRTHTKDESAPTTAQALSETIEALRELRDCALTEDPNSQPALFLGQLTLFFQRTAHGVSVTADDFRSLLHTVGLAEEKQPSERVEV